MFLTIEGGDGSGKSTLIEALRPRFDLVTREPGGCSLSERLREIILHEPMSDDAETLLFLAARAENLEEVIRPALSSGQRVLCDRFNDSTIAYQGYGRGLGRERIEALCNLACRDLQPDLTIYLDLDPKIALGRLQGKSDRLESEELAFHQRIREGYLELARDYERIHVIDASQSPQEVVAQAKALL